MLDKILHFQGDILFLFARNYSFSNSAPPFTILRNYRYGKSVSIKLVLKMWVNTLKQLKIQKQNKKGLYIRSFLFAGSGYVYRLECFNLLCLFKHLSNISL